MGLSHGGFVLDVGIWGRKVQTKGVVMAVKSLLVTYGEGAATLAWGVLMTQGGRLLS